MDTMICDLPHHYQALVFIAVLSIESWLGKTTKTASGSIFEILYKLVKKPFTKEKL